MERSNTLKNLREIGFAPEEAESGELSRHHASKNSPAFEFFPPDILHKTPSRV